MWQSSSGMAQASTSDPIVDIQDIFSLSIMISDQEIMGASTYRE